MPYIELENIDYLRSTRNQLKSRFYEKAADLDIKFWHSKEPLTFDKRFSGTEAAGEVGKSWGGLFDCAWFLFKGTIPECASGKTVACIIDISGEMYIADENGNPIRGLTTFKSGFDPSLGEGTKTEYIISEKAEAGHNIEFWADAGCNDLFGNYPDSGTIKSAYIAIVNKNIRSLYYDFDVLLDLVEHLPKNRARYKRVLFALHEASNCLKKFDDGEIEKAKSILKCELDKKNGDYSLLVSAVGHAHMDLAWLWPIRETIRKGARTFSTLMRNLEAYPDYKFGASQAQFFKWIKDYYPSLYEETKKNIAEGRIELQGGMWVESDGSLPSGEAFCRQYLYGQRFFRREFGQTVEVSSLPDSFGFAANLPQIFLKSGTKYFMAHRPYLNANYKYHHTFWWVGADGSKIITHILPEATYNSTGSPRSILKAEQDFCDNGISENALILFGIGDGGGGPGEEHLERMERVKNLEGIAPVKQEFMLDFFKRLEKDSHKFKAWEGELFFKIFQGTFASQSKNKYYNRQLENALRELEYASVLNMNNKKYPLEKINEFWEETLLYQFHDILPGSSIERVNIECVDRYRIMLEEIKLMTKAAYEEMFGGGESSNAAAINSLSWERNEWIQHENKWGKVSVKPFSSAAVEFCDDFSDEQIKADANCIENDCIKLTFNSDGTISSIYDKLNTREALKGAGNVFSVYEDFGDGWMIKNNYRGKGADCFELISSETGIDGPVAFRTSKFRYENSFIEQKIVITLGSSRIDFITNVDIHDQHKMFRTSFPVWVKTNDVTCEVQFGNVTRPIHENTMLDMDRFETYAHKWFDFSDRNYGVAMLNDGLYGISIRDTTLDLDMIRTTTYPGKNGDIGKHSFMYSIYPHSKDYTNGVIKEAYKLNNKLYTVPASADFDMIKPIISFSEENIIIESIKKAEDSDNLIIRVYEAFGVETLTKFESKYNNIKIVNILEDDYQDNSLDIENSTIHFNPFTIHTLMLSMI